MQDSSIVGLKHIAQTFISLADAVSHDEADWSAMRALTTPDFQLHTPGEDGPVDFDGFIRMSHPIMEGFPGLHHEVEFQVAEGDKVVNRIILHGVHAGTFRGVAPTHREVRMAIINIMRIRDGKIVEFWRLSDITGLMEQISGKGSV